MRSPYTTRRLASLLLVLLGVSASAAAQQTAAGQQPSAENAAEHQAVDGIAAVVNKQVITLRQVDAQVRTAEAQLKQQNIAVPDRQILRRQVLQRMISDELLRQEAERLNIEVTDAGAEQAAAVIAQRNRMTPEQLRAEIERSGVSWADYLKDLRHEVMVDQLRQRTVDRNIHISDADVDAFLKSQQRRSGLGSLNQRGQAQQGQQAQQAQPSVLGLAQILVAVPEGASAAEVQRLRSKAEELLSRLRAGADFASLAASSSDAPEALQGGDLGVRPPEGWPDLFLQATQGVQAGGVSDIVQSGNGFHILKVVTRGQEAQQPAQAQAPAAAAPSQQAPMPEGPMMVTQTHASHILIKITPAMSEQRARERARQLEHRLSMGENFEELARLYSEDASAPQGGDLGWLNPGETVPAFEQAMNALQPGQISAPVLSQFGWHIIRVDDRREKDMEDEYRRMQARQILFQRRVEPAFEDWLSQLRGQAYIDNRLDPQSSRRPR
ncbi:periplasmic chaperone for outer membrane proteins SurA [Pusillimonas noertemannii]|uniref:Chaperone SurA n=2 Tax=Pusillimonas noertemannii TaxID=305977 RepID=A0A2U1CKP1_9BURK|nr:peptidylprolyl isomerase [Pusillimonas noertemannii]PVY61562.1 periplasmic chaperone for outer membrane proteins SurA [Pusillimonas noertemannii]